MAIRIVYCIGSRERCAARGSQIWGTMTYDDVAYGEIVMILPRRTYSRGWVRRTPNSNSSGVRIDCIQWRRRYISGKVALNSNLASHQRQIGTRSGAGRNWPSLHGRRRGLGRSSSPFLRGSSWPPAKASAPMDAAIGCFPWRTNRRGRPIAFHASVPPPDVQAAVPALSPPAAAAALQLIVRRALCRAPRGSSRTRERDA